MVAVACDQDERIDPVCHSVGNHQCGDSRISLLLFVPRHHTVTLAALLLVFLVESEMGPQTRDRLQSVPILPLSSGFVSRPFYGGGAVVNELYGLVSPNNRRAERSEIEPLVPVAVRLAQTAKKIESVDVKPNPLRQKENLLDGIRRMGIVFSVSKPHRGHGLGPTLPTSWAAFILYHVCQPLLGGVGTESMIPAIQGRC